MESRSFVRWTFTAILLVFAAALIVLAAQPGATGAGRPPKQPTAVPAVPVTGGGDGGVIDPDLTLPEEVGLDPDLPLIAQGKIKKGDYLKARAENIQALRGLPYAKAGEARAEALRTFEAQKAALCTSGPESVTAAWTFVGPAPLPNGQTTNVSTAVSGRVTCIAVHPTDPSKVYVGTAQGGVYRSLDGGVTWTPLMDTAQTLAIGAVAIAPSQPTTIYVGTGESGFSADSFFGVGVYRIDNAETTANLSGPFNPLVSTAIAGTTAFTGRAISKILVHPTDPATIFVSTTSGIHGNGGDGRVGTTVPPLALRGIYRSSDATSGSPSFSKLTVTTAGSVAPDTTGGRDITDMVLEPGNPNNLIAWVYGNAAAGDGGVYRSTNALAASPTFGQTFTTTISASRGEFAINKVGSVVTVVAATGEGASGSGRLRISTDGGVTWPTSYVNLGAPSIGFCYAQCWYDIAVAVDPNSTGSGLVIYLGGGANSNNSRMMVKSSNAGANWTDISTGLHADTHALAVAPSNPSIVYEGNDGGIFKTTNAGANWTSLNNTMFSATQFQSLALHPFDRYFTIGGTQDNGTEWQKPDQSWIRADYGDGGYALIDQSATDTTNVRMYHTYYNQAGSLMGFGTVNNTANAHDAAWAFYGCGGTANGISCSATSVLFYAPMALGPGSPNTLYYGNDKLYRSSDNGATMTLASQSPIVSGSAITTIGVSPQDDNVRIVGLRNGQVWATTTGSSTLTNVTSASFPLNPGSATGLFVGRAVIDPNNKYTAYVTFAYYAAAGQGIWKTTNLNAGTPTWTAAGSGIPSIPINALVVDPQNSNVLYAGTDVGVYQSTDGSASWSPFGTGLPAVAVFDLAIQNPSRTLRAATHGRGIYEIPIPGVPLPVLNLGTITAAPTSGNGDAYIDPGENATMTVQVGNSGFGPATGIVGTISTATPNVTILNNTSTYPDLAAGSSGTNATAFTFQVGAGFPCGQAITFTLTAAYAQPGSPRVLTFKVLTGHPAAAATSFTYAGAPVAIPDNTPAGIDVPIAVSGLSGAAYNVVLSLDGSSCSATPGSTTVGIDHTYVGDLQISLVAPSGATVALSQNNGANGVNFCNTVFDDAAGTSITAIAAAQNPFTGSFRPVQALSGLKGEAANGTWKLHVADTGPGDIGSVRAFTLKITPTICCPVITLGPANLPAAILNVPYNQSITASGGTAPYAFAITGGALPPGWSLNGSTGAVTGTATSTTFSASFTVTATDANGCQGTKAFAFGVYSAFFLDDLGRSRVCVNTSTGVYQWDILLGAGMGTYTGTANILNGGAKIVSKVGAANTLNVTYDPIRRKATGYFIAGGVYSPLSDSNTANNVGGCS